MRTLRRNSEPIFQPLNGTPHTQREVGETIPRRIALRCFARPQLVIEKTKTKPPYVPGAGVRYLPVSTNLSCVLHFTDDKSEKQQKQLQLQQQ